HSWHGPQRNHLHAALARRDHSVWAERQERRQAFAISLLQHLVASAVVTAQEHGARKSHQHDAATWQAHSIVEHRFRLRTDLAALLFAAAVFGRAGFCASNLRSVQVLPRSALTKYVP